MGTPMQWPQMGKQTLAQAIVGAGLFITAGTATTPRAARTAHECVLVAPASNDGAGRRWHAVSESPLHFAVEWNGDFQSHDLLWKNAASHPVRLTFSADSVSSNQTRRVTRALLPGEVEALPGHGVTPSRDGVVCVGITPLP